MKLCKGARIYFTGDRLFPATFGTITGLNRLSVEILFDDGRKDSVHVLCFEPRAGRRYWLADEWERSLARFVTREWER
jgi:hypothetical protein